MDVDLDLGTVSRGPVTISPPIINLRGMDTLNIFGRREVILHEKSLVHTSWWVVILPH